MENLQSKQIDPSTETLSPELARWAAGLRFEDLPEQAIHHVRRSLIDFLGVTIRGATKDLPRSVQAFLKETEGDGRASVIGTDLTMSSAAATMANGTAASVLELDDGHSRATIHPGATCIPAVLALAEVYRASIRQVVVAIAIAYEASSRLGIAICGPAAERGFHCTPMVGVLGATFGASKIVGSDARATWNALGLAGSNAGGLFDYHSGWQHAWSVNAGRVGREALLCTMLSRSNVSGPIDILDGAKGLGAAFAGRALDRSTVLEAIGREWRMLETAVKIYPCCRRVHAVIDAVLALKAEAGADAPAVDRILVETSAESARLNRKTFEDTSAAQMSIPYAAAAAFIFGQPRLEHFDEKARCDPRLVSLAQRVEVRESDIPVIADPMRLTARVSLKIGDRTYSALVTKPTGDPANPVSDRMLEDKFHELAAPVIGSASANRLTEALWALGKVDPTDSDKDSVLHLMKECRPI